MTDAPPVFEKAVLDAFRFLVTEHGYSESSRRTTDGMKEWVYSKETPPIELLISEGPRFEIAGGEGQERFREDLEVVLTPADSEEGGRGPQSDASDSPVASVQRIGAFCREHWDERALEAALEQMRDSQRQLQGLERRTHRLWTWAFLSLGLSVVGLLTLLVLMYLGNS